MNEAKTGMNDVRELTLAELETVAGGDPSTGAVYADGGGYSAGAGGAGFSSGGVTGLIRLIASRLE